MNMKDNLEENFRKEYEKARAEITKPNVLVLGGTGVGKSSLINSVFGDKVASVGVGKPQTKGINKYSLDTITIFDSEGYESGKDNQNKFKKEIVEFVTKRQGSLVSQIHLAWYCISLPGHRVLDVDMETIAELKANKVPVALVFTKADEASEAEENEMIASVRKISPDLEIFIVSDQKDVDRPTQPLVDWSYENIDKAVKYGFAASARDNVKIKAKESKNIYLQHAALAATAAASPIPMSDAPLIMATQTTMMARLASLWQLPALKSAVSGGVLTQLLSQIGRTLVGNALKFFPGVGSVAGGLLNATVASSITAAVGWAVSDRAEKYTLEIINGNTPTFSEYFSFDVMEPLISQYLKESR
jgi:uncharacterized protein (DUF697 family)/GTP-binding protein EngB required for normal cell division